MSASIWAPIASGALCLLASSFANAEPAGLRFSGAAYVETNKTFPTGRILIDGLYVNALGAVDYSDGENGLSALVIAGTRLDGTEASDLNKLNVNVCGAHIQNDLRLQLCATHYFNPTGEPFNDLYVAIIGPVLSVQVGDYNLQDSAGPYAEIAVRGRMRLDSKLDLSWRLVGAEMFDPNKSYGSAQVELSLPNGLFANVHLYSQEGYQHPDVTVRSGVRF